MKRAWPVVAVVAVVAVAIGAVWLVRDDAPTPARNEASNEQSSAPSEPASSSPSAEPDPSCAETAQPFAPRRISVPGVAKRVPVTTPPRDANGVPGIPPLTAEGKFVFAWDREQEIRPGDPAGNVLLNAHTWPDGSALGNDLLDGLRKGDRIVVSGDDARLCYRVTERVEVLAAEGMPRYFEKDGPHQLAIVVCSGRRLGPGQWEKRTVWFASPAAA
jgi:hypothetical protein